MMPWDLRKMPWELRNNTPSDLWALINDAERVMFQTYPPEPVPISGASICALLALIVSLQERIAALEQCCNTALPHERGTP